MNVPRAPVTPEKAARGQRLRQLRDHFKATQEGFLGSAKRVQVVGAEAGQNNLTGQLLLTYARRVGVEPETLTAYFNGEIPLAGLLGAATDSLPVGTPLRIVETEREERQSGGSLERVRARLRLRYPNRQTEVDAVVGGSDFIDAQNLDELEAFTALDDILRMGHAESKGKLQHAPAAPHPKKPPKVGR